jgi:predicted nucleic acid-binding protein
MYRLDTDWIIQVFGKREPATRTLHVLADSQVHVSLVTVGELYDGAFATVNPQAHLVAARQFLGQYHVIDLSDPVMERFAEIRSHLRRRGELIPDFDLLVAATALHHNLTLLTFNRRHFHRIPDLRLYQPA